MRAPQGALNAFPRTIHEAAQMTWFHDPLHGLVVYSGKRNRKPIGVINKNDLLQLISTGA